MCDKIDEKLRWMWMCKQNLCDKMRMLNSGTISKEQSVKKGNRQWSHGSCISFQMRFAYAFNGRAASFCPVFNYLFICCYVTALNRLLHSTEMSFNAGSMLCITCSIEIHLQWCDESIKFCVMTIISEMRPITQGENRMAINQLQKKNDWGCCPNWRLLERITDWGRVHRALFNATKLTISERIWGLIINILHTLHILMGWLAREICYENTVCPLVCFCIVFTSRRSTSHCSFSNFIIAGPWIVSVWPYAKW